MPPLPPDPAPPPHQGLTQDEYLALLRSECRQRGFVDWSDDITAPSIMQSLPSFDDYVHGVGLPLHHSELTSEQWLDVVDYPGTRSLYPFGDDLDVSDDVFFDQVGRENEARRELLQRHASQHLDEITKKIIEQYTQAGGQLAHLEQLHTGNPVSTILSRLAELWRLQESSRGEASSLKRDSKARLKIFSDIPQEATNLVDLNVPIDSTFSAFKSRINTLPLIRHLVKIHAPFLARNLFTSDETAWPSGSYPRRRRAPAEYEIPGNGWYVHVMKKVDTEGMVGKPHRWEALDNEEQWIALMRDLEKNTSLTAALRHESTRERMELVRRVEGMEKEQMQTMNECREFNIHLERHRMLVKDDLKRLMGGILREEDSGDEGMLSEAAEEEETVVEKSKEMAGQQPARLGLHSLAFQIHQKP